MTSLTYHRALVNTDVLSDHIEKISMRLTVTQSGDSAKRKKKYIRPSILLWEPWLQKRQWRDVIGAQYK